VGKARAPHGAGRGGPPLSRQGVRELIRTFPAIAQLSSRTPVNGRRPSTYSERKPARSRAHCVYWFRRPVFNGSPRSYRAPFACAPLPRANSSPAGGRCKDPEQASGRPLVSARPKIFKVLLTGRRSVSRGVREGIGPAIHSAPGPRWREEDAKRKGGNPAAKWVHFPSRPRLLPTGFNPKNAGRLLSLGIRIPPVET